MIRNLRIGPLGIFTISALLISTAILSLVPTADAHPPEEMVLSYDYASQTLNITITHTTPTTSQHYIESVQVFRDEVMVIDETYTEQPTVRVFYLEFEVLAEDGAVLEVQATCNLWGSLNETMVVIGPRERMEITVNEIDELEMGEEWDFTINIEQENNGDPLDGVSVEVRAAIGELSEVSELGIGGYAFTYTAPELEDEDLEVINITASRNGYHTEYYEFAIDIIFPVDDSRKIVVTLSPKFTTINEGQSKEITATVTVKEGNAPLDISEIKVERSGGVITTENTGTGIFLMTFRANDVSTDVNGWIKVTAEKEGYAKGSDQMAFKIKDTGAPVDDDDDDDNITVSNESELFSPTNIIIIVVVLAIIGGGIGFYVYKKMKK